MPKLVFNDQTPRYRVRVSRYPAFKHAMEVAGWSFFEVNREGEFVRIATMAPLDVLMSYVEATL